MDTMLIKLTNKKAAALLHKLEELHLIKILKEHNTNSISLSSKYKGIMSKQNAVSLNKHIKQMRGEW